MAKRKRYPGNFANNLTEWEISVRDDFVKQFFIDQDYVAAAARVGFAGNNAIDYGMRFKRDPYVQKKLAEERIKIANEDGNRTRNQTIIYNGLMREAHNTDPGSSHSARVGAFAHLMKAEKMEAPTVIESKVEHSGSVATTIDYSKCSEEELEMIRKLLELRAAKQNE